MNSSVAARDAGGSPGGSSAGAGVGNGNGGGSTGGGLVASVWAFAIELNTPRPEIIIRALIFMTHLSFELLTSRRASSAL